VVWVDLHDRSRLSLGERGLFVEQAPAMCHRLVERCIVGAVSAAIHHIFLASRT
jgi:hypothetical protein